MQRRVVIAAGIAAALFASPALAEPPYPKVDFEGDWVMTTNKGMVIKAQMHYMANPRKMRVDVNQQGMAMSSVRDMASGDMVMWSQQMPGMAMRLPSPKEDDFEGAPTSETKTVNGEDCTVWQLKATEVCLTDDNIPLEVTTTSGIRTGLENMQRTAQDPALFEIPDGLKIMDMPAAAAGSGPQPGQGMPF
jgi:hypothetical protein